MDLLETVLLWGGEDHRPNQVRDVAHQVLLPEPEAGAEVRIDPEGAVARGSRGLHPLELDAVLDPGLVEVLGELELCGLALVLPVIMRKRLEPLPPLQKQRQWRQT